MNSESPRWSITETFARWATRAAISQAARNKERNVDTTRDGVNAALDAVDFAPLFDRNLGIIHVSEFTEWHKLAVNRLREVQPEMSFGWAAKTIAEYLKVTCYMAGFGREGLKNVIHPPIDGKLLKELPKQSWETNHLKDLLRMASKKGIVEIDEDSYNYVITVFRLAACERKCTLFEVEQYWRP